ncbi:heat shock 70 kDa protein 4 isoform X1 [Sesbania bispinosa]|nr:heat shock 70 kDa protein 4 isoform X1 [Sesbania bispinosa]
MDPFLNQSSSNLQQFISTTRVQQHTDWTNGKTKNRGTKRQRQPPQQRPPRSGSGNQDNGDHPEAASTNTTKMTTLKRRQPRSSKNAAAVMEFRGRANGDGGIGQQRCSDFPMANGSEGFGSLAAILLGLACEMEMEKLGIWL